MPDTVDLLASRYLLEEPIAAGGFGEVWRGTDVILGRAVAVKLLRPELARDPVVLARFRAEARHGAGLCHPNIAAVHDFCEPAAPGSPFLVMEFVAGPSLSALLAAGPVTGAAAMGVVAGAAAGLAAAHRGGVVHRDIKPANLLFTNDGTVKITDFGICHAAGSAPLTATGVLMGTPAYMAPERLAGAAGTPASDIYSLGVVAYHAVSGTMPFAGTPLEVAVAHLERPMPPLPPSVPAEVAAFITQLTARNPAARPARADEVAARAARLRDQLTARPARIAPAATAPVRAAAARPGPGRYCWRAAITAAAAAVIIAGVHQADGRDPATPSAAQVVLPALAGPRPSGPDVAAAQTVVVKASSLIGEQVTAAARQLRALGLSVLITCQPAGSHTPGTVVSANPDGRVAAGSRINLDTACSTAASPAPAGRPAPAADQTHHRGTRAQKRQPRKPADPSSGDAWTSPGEGSTSPAPTATSGQDMRT